MSHFLEIKRFPIILVMVIVSLGTTAPGISGAQSRQQQFVVDSRLRPYVPTKSEIETCNKKRGCLSLAHEAIRMPVDAQALLVVNPALFVDYAQVSAPNDAIQATANEVRTLLNIGQTQTTIRPSGTASRIGPSGLPVLSTGSEILDLARKITTGIGLQNEYEQNEANQLAAQGGIIGPPRSSYYSDSSPSSVSGVESNALPEAPQQLHQPGGQPNQEPEIEPGVPLKYFTFRGPYEDPDAPTIIRSDGRFVYDLTTGKRYEITESRPDSLPFGQTLLLLITQQPIVERPRRDDQSPDSLEGLRTPEQLGVLVHNEGAGRPKTVMEYIYWRRGGSIDPGDAQKEPLTTIRRQPAPIDPEDLQRIKPLVQVPWYKLRKPGIYDPTYTPTIDASGSTKKTPLTTTTESKTSPGKCQPGSPDC